jgi:hypothetical protein
MKIKYFLASLMLLLGFVSVGQEFNATVSVSSKRIQGTDKRIYDDLQENLRIFINERRWTNIDFSSSERIDCSFLLNVKEKNGNTFKVDLSVIYTRPVFNSSYTSPILNYLDEDFVFDYTEGQVLEFNENSFSSNVSSVISFYLYLILAIDFDSMSPNGGEKFYETAANIYNSAQSSGDNGWINSFGENNRAAFFENYTNPAYQDLHTFLYEFHYNGLDHMHKDKTKGKQSLLKSLSYLKNVYEKEPALFALSLMINAKRDEMISIFSEGTPAEKANATQILKQIDPAHSGDYSKIIRGK